MKIAIVLGALLLIFLLVVAICIDLCSDSRSGSHEGYWSEPQSGGKLDASDMYYTTDEKRW